MKTTTKTTTAAQILKLKDEWKVLFKCAYKFYIENGADHDAAELLALRSTREKMKLAKKVKTKF